jgi:hypothetical protein
VTPSDGGASGKVQASGGLERLAGGPALPGALQPSNGAAHTAAHAEGVRSWPLLRLIRLHLASRRVLTCLLVLVGCGAALRLGLHWLPRTGTLSRQIPLTIEAAAAAAIGVTVRSPFGEPERVTGRWLPFLRVIAVVGLAGCALGALAAGAASAHLAGGSLELLRDLAGFIGLAMLAAGVLGGGLAWIGPVAYLGVALAALAGRWATPWTWPARPPHDHGAAICAAAVFAAGVVVITVRGARDAARE